MSALGLNIKQYITVIVLKGRDCKKYIKNVQKLNYNDQMSDGQMSRVAKCLVFSSFPNVWMVYTVMMAQYRDGHML